ncbi:TATA box binding protein associated factor (TAF) domain-containing protein [Ditylenchus destructor]|nr:TATA box binding protein associated factor (TAF) domain-containing protein [Ditylenchus destructor]
MIPQNAPTVMLNRNPEQPIRQSCGRARSARPSPLEYFIMELEDDNMASTSGAEEIQESSELGNSFVTVMADQLGIADFSQQASSEVSSHVSFIIKIVLNMAKKFQTCGRRRVMIADDIEGALAFYGLSPQFGYEIVNENIPLRYAGTLGQDLYVRDDPEVELTALTNGMLPKLPLEITMKAHWLVIDGVQPAIPENPAPELEPEAPLVNGQEKGVEPTTSSLLLNQLAKSVRKTEQVQVKTHTATHALSLEQQVFFKEITEAIMGGDTTKQTEALHCLQYDCGLNALLPRLSVTIHEGVRCNIVQRNLVILIYLMRMVQALLSNENLSVGRCLHELLPSIMSCILSRQISNQQTDKDNKGHHWLLRDFSAKLLKQIADKYKQHLTLRARITHQLVRAFHDPRCSIATLYGAAFALSLLGEDTIRTALVPKADLICSAMKRICSDKNSMAVENPKKLHDFLVKVFTDYAKATTPLKDSGNVQDFRQTFGGFGDDVYRAKGNAAPNLV